MPAAPIYRPGESIDGPLADKSALCQSIGRLQDIPDLDGENTLSALGAINLPYGYRGSLLNVHSRSDGCVQGLIWWSRVC